jgi:hypothetical protein
MLRKARTCIIDKAEVDIMVTQFLCHDDTLRSHFGKGSKESTWAVQAGKDATPIGIKLHVDRNVISYPELAVECDGKHVFPLNGHAKGKLREDFTHQWPFRGSARGIGEKNRFEVRSAGTGSEHWFPATLTKQREDGLFELLALMPDNAGAFKEVSYPAVCAADIRDAATGKMFQVPERTLTLEVPASDPTNATLCVDGHDLITHHFARATPPPSVGPKAINVDVSKDRENAQANVGHSVLAHYLSNEVRAVTQNAEKRKCTWTIQVGPFAEHNIEIETRMASRIVTLTVDGETLVEASAEDIDCVGDHWECKFRLVGENCLNFNVPETNADGCVLDSRAVVDRRSKFVRECRVSLSDESNLHWAELFVDGVDFRNLPMKREEHEEERVQVTAQAFRMTYGVPIPYKVNEEASSGLSAFLGGNLVQVQGAESTRASPCPCFLGTCA